MTLSSSWGSTGSSQALHPQKEILEQESKTKLVFGLTVQVPADLA